MERELNLYGQKQKQIQGLKRIISNFANNQ